MASLNPLRRWQRRLLYSTVWALLASGIGWLALHYFLGAGADQLPQPGEPWLMRLHGLAGFSALFAAGILASAHIPQGWRMNPLAGRVRGQSGSQRVMGIALILLGAACMASAYVLYYFAPEDIRALIGWAHAIAGVSLALLLPLHGWR